MWVWGGLKSLKRQGKRWAGGGKSGCGGVVYVGVYGEEEEHRKEKRQGHGLDNSPFSGSDWFVFWSRKSRRLPHPFLGG